MNNNSRKQLLESVQKSLEHIRQFIQDVNHLFGYIADLNPVFSAHIPVPIEDHRSAYYFWLDD